jgi:hypothetical protein
VIVSVEADATLPLLSSSETATVDPAFPPGAMFAVGGVVKTSWVGTGGVAVPPRAMVCVALVAFRLLSVRTSEPLMVPNVVGAKLMGRVQLAPDASVAGELPVVSSGHADPPLLLSVKLAAMLGSLPVIGMGKVSGMLPMFEIVAVCGPSVVSVDPTLVAVAKRRPLALTFTLRMLLLPVSAM